MGSVTVMELERLQREVGLSMAIVARSTILCDFCQELVESVVNKFYDHGILA